MKTKLLLIGILFIVGISACKKTETLVPSSVTTPTKTTYTVEYKVHILADPGQSLTINYLVASSNNTQTVTVPIGQVTQDWSYALQRQSGDYVSISCAVPASIMAPGTNNVKVSIYYNGILLKENSAGDFAIASANGILPY